VSHFTLRCSISPEVLNTAIAVKRFSAIILVLLQVIFDNTDNLSTNSAILAVVVEVFSKIFALDFHDCCSSSYIVVGEPERRFGPKLGRSTYVAPRLWVYFRFALLKVLQTGHRWLAVHAWLWLCNAIEQAANGGGFFLQHIDRIMNVFYSKWQLLIKT